MGSVQAYTNLVAYSSCLFLNAWAMGTSQPTTPLAANLSHNFTKVEENAIYYTSALLLRNCYFSTKHMRGNRIFGENNSQFTW